MIEKQVESPPGSGWRAGRLAAALVAALAIAAAFGATQAAASGLPVLHVAGQEIRDSHGRQVLLRGVNTTALTDQYQVNPKMRPVVPTTDRDYRRMKAMGFNVIRLALTWSSLEPKRGQINSGYIDRIAKAVRKAADHGMYTVLDMHNGGWGKYVATPPDEKCPEGLHPAHGWLGAPEWATFTDGKTTCQDTRINKRTEAVKAAWDNFWTNHAEPDWLNGLGIQDHLVAMWAVLAQRFADDPAVAGYDLLNEPDPGNTERNQRAYASQFDADSIAAIRKAEANAGGFSHMVFFEPNLTWSQHGLTSHTPEPGFTRDRNIVFAPHLYGRDVHTTERPIKLVRRDLKKQARRVSHKARQYGSALWIGEWSFSIFDEDALKKLRTHIKIQDSRELGSAWWQWKVACGSPQTFKGLDPTPTHQPVGNLNPVKCPSGDRIQRPKGWMAVVSRAYPRFSPGTLTKLHSHGARMSLEGKSPCNEKLRQSEPKACKLIVWIPKHKVKRRLRRPRTEDHNVKHVRVRGVPGGWVATGSVTGKYSLTTR